MVLPELLVADEVRADDRAGVEHQDDDHEHPEPRKARSAGTSHFLTLNRVCQTLFDTI